MGLKKGLQLHPVDIVDRIAPADFLVNYVRANRPLVMRGLSHDWPALEKWSLDYMVQVMGEHPVPLFRTGAINPRAKVNAPACEMPFAEYIGLIEQGPTDLRIFLLNAFRAFPELLKDFHTPDLMDGFLNRFPMLFFGSKGSRVFLHFDIDMSEVFHTQFDGRKRAILFGPDQSRALYKIPFSVRSFMDLDVEAPDYGKFPALQHAQGLEAQLEHGDTLYIPSGWWHHMHYLENGFALSQRAMARDFSTRLLALHNMLVVKPTETIVRKMIGK
ncbi:MAG: cupin-like domain-containing protein, partial [Bacteroidota bacterium]